RRRRHGRLARRDAANSATRHESGAPVPTGAPPAKSLSRRGHSAAPDAAYRARRSPSGGPRLLLRSQAARRVPPPARPLPTTTEWPLRVEPPSRTSRTTHMPKATISKRVLDTLIRAKVRKVEQCVGVEPLPVTWRHRDRQGCNWEI